MPNGIASSAGQSGHELPNEDDVAYWLIPVGTSGDKAPEEWIQLLVGQENIWASATRRPLDPGDRICFYAAAQGVVAHATVHKAPENKCHPKVDPDNPEWVIELKDVSLYLDEPVVVDAELRAKLDAFEGRDESKPWSWFVQGAHEVSQHDFLVLTQQ